MGTYEEQPGYRLYTSLPGFAAHKCVAEIDLAALRHNFRSLRALVRQNGTAPRMICVVKADAYGHGADACVQALLAEGCDFFAVSCLEEAVAVRRVCRAAQAPADILILGYTLPELAPKLAAYDILQTILSPAYAASLAAEAERTGCRVRCHLGLDTGMNRIGLLAQTDEQVARAVEDAAAICAQPRLCVEGMLTHFARADETDAAMTDRQFARYEAVCRGLAARGISLPCLHVANSAASVRFPAMHLSCVREGILLYGVNPSRDVTVPDLRPVMRLKTVISHVHTLTPGETVSYGGTYHASEPRTLATLPIGYADGLIRACSGASVRIHTRGGVVEAPIVGRICMDQCMLDVTGMTVQPGDEVVIFGDTNEQLYALAERADTIAYELLCLISGRVPRLYR